MQQSKLFDRIIVSTDSHEIAEIARSCGADVPFLRPETLAGDFVGTAEVLLHALEWLTAEEGECYDEACCVYPTALLITAEQLVESARQLEAATVDCVFSAVRSHQPVERAMRHDHDGHCVFAFPEHAKSRTQDLPEAFFDAGQFYWLKTRAFEEAKAILGKASRAFILPEWCVQDVDTEDDWALAEYKYSLAAKIANANVD